MALSRFTLNVHSVTRNFLQRTLERTCVRNCWKSFEDQKEGKPADQLDEQLLQMLEVRPISTCLNHIVHIVGEILAKAQCIQLHIGCGLRKGRAFLDGYLAKLLLAVQRSLNFGTLQGVAWRFQPAAHVSA